MFLTVSDRLYLSETVGIAISHNGCYETYIPIQRNLKVEPKWIKD